MSSKYYASGIEITKEEKDQIVCGKQDKFLRGPSKQPGIPLCWFTDHINIKDGKLDTDDPLLREALEALELPLEKTFIVQIFPEPDPNDSLTATKRGALFGYW